MTVYFYSERKVMGGLDGSIVFQEQYALSEIIQVIDLKGGDAVRSLAAGFCLC